MTMIEYPEPLPQGRTYQYVPADNPHMQEARAFALSHSLDANVKTGSVVVKDNEIIGRGANGSNYHDIHGCERKRLGSKTGEDYDKCEGCHPKNHSEPRALSDAKAHGNDTTGADLYLWGHWWCCTPCWKAILDGGIANVYLLEGSEILFDREKEGNILGRW